MEEPQKKRQLLFLNTDNRDFTTQPRSRSKTLDSRVRRHLMVDIGMSRRKPSRTRQFDTLVWSLADTPQTLSSPDHGEDSTARDVDNHSQTLKKNSVVPETAAHYNTLFCAASLTLHALSVFEKEWGEDMFSAYGFTLIMVTGRNAVQSTCSTNTFWFPFAFRQSAFLRHYEQIFTSPNVLIPLYRRSARELRSLALERSLETIQCVESRLSSSDASRATSDSVLHAVLAMICYNFIAMDFDQAMVHVKGLWMVVMARGGISTLESNQGLMVMISWVDVTAALLHDTKPLFPLSTPKASTRVLPVSGLETLPTPLLSIINDENTQISRFTNVISCIGELNALAAFVSFELAAKGNGIWDDEEQMGFLINPVTHQLLDQPSGSEAVTRWGIISEALRLGAIIWIIRVKRRCRSYPGTAETAISTLLKMLSSQYSAEHVWNSPDLRLVRLWLLVLCGIGEPSDQDLTKLRGMIASGMKEPRSLSWVEVMAFVRQMPWVDMFEPPCAKLGQQLLL